MDKIETDTSTSEKLISRTKEEIIKEAKRIEESALYSSKGHFVAASYWTNFHLWIGIPIVVLSAIAGAFGLSHLDEGKFVAGGLSIVIAGLSSVMTFLNPNGKASVHLNSGNNYDGLQNRARIFWNIDCWREESEQVLTERLKHLSEEKDKLNQNCPQIPPWAYNRAKKGIEEGEANYRVDAQS